MENSNYKISWLKVIGVIIAFIAIIAIVCMLYPKNNKSQAATTNTYVNNINLMKEAGFEYFRETNLPEKIGASKEITLEEMLDSKLIMDFVDENGKTCDVHNSYIKVTRTLDREYAMKVVLNCENKSDYIVTSIVDGKRENNITDNESNDSNTSNKNNSSSNNSSNNNGNSSNKYNSNGSSNVTHITNVNINYVNTCKGCNTNCGNNCLNNVYYSVYFDAQGGDFVPKQTIKQYDTVNYVVTAREGYEFLGWYLNGQKYDFNTPVTRTITLIAKWKKINNDKPIVDNKHTVYFDSNGGTYIGSKTVKEGNAVSRPSNPTRNGYTFIGWYYNGSKFNFSTKIYRDYTLTARWEKDEVKYNTYCKIINKTYYSTNYVNANQSQWNKNWTIRFDNLDDVQNLTITDIGYINTTSQYNSVYQDFARKGISMVNGVNKYEVPVSSGSMLKTYSLKSSNFNKFLSKPYYSRGYWYTDASISIRNFNNVTKYYASNIGQYIYFTPFYFEVEYTDMNSCVNDFASRSSSYRNYEIVDTFYR